jgi:hypothetical protein
MYASVKCSVCGKIFDAKFNLVSLNCEKELDELEKIAKCSLCEPEWKARVFEGKAPCLTMEILNKAVALHKGLNHEI